MTTEQETTGYRIKTLRKAAKLTQDELGELLGVTGASISSIETGRHEPSNEALRKLSERFNVSVDYLISGEEEDRTLKSNGVIVPIVYEPNAEFGSYADLPLIPSSARAGFVKSFIKNSTFEQMEKYRVFNVDSNLLRKNPVVIEIDGDSMEPTLKPGAKVLGVPVDRGNWPYLSGKIYAVVYKDYFVVKRIKENLIMVDGTVTLDSDNPAGGSMTVPAAEIFGIWQVVKGLEFPIP